MLLVASAFAAEPGDAWECPTLLVPEDGLRYADPGVISEAAYEAIEAWILLQYDDGCPAACAHASGEDCAYVDDCTTAAGTHVVVDYDQTYWDDGYSEWWSVERWVTTIELADGTRLDLDADRRRRSDNSIGLYQQRRMDWEASWSGALDAALPESASIVVSYEGEESYDFMQSGEEVEELTSDACAWTASRWSSGYQVYTEVETQYAINVGDQTLTLDFSPLCGNGARLATLDGTPMLVEYTTWALTADPDGDLAVGDHDCDEADPTVSECAEDPVCDGIDQDCDGSDDVDADDDGHAAECAGGDDCDDADPGLHPGNSDYYQDGLDQDCDGVDGPRAEAEDYGTDPGARGRREPEQGCGSGRALVLLLALPWVRPGTRRRRAPRSEGPRPGP